MGDDEASATIYSHVQLPQCSGCRALITSFSTLSCSARKLLFHSSTRCQQDNPVAITRSPRRPHSAWESREKIVLHIIGLTRTSHLQKVAADTSGAPPKIRAQSIAKVAAGLGVLSATEASVAIRRHVRNLYVYERRLLRLCFS